MRIVGIMLIVFIKEEHTTNLYDVMGATVGTGLMGMMVSSSRYFVREVHNFTRFDTPNVSRNCWLSYQKGDLVKQPVKSRDVLPKSVPGVGWGMSCRGGVGHTGVGWGMSCRGGVGHTGVGWVTQGWGGSYRGGMIHTEHYHHLHTVLCGNYLELLREPNSITTTHQLLTIT